MGILQNMEILLKKYSNNQKIVHQYGTAGFRNKAEHLPHVIFRVGILASLRARYTKAVVGTMITASHNPEEDNGAKVIDPSGGMLESSWEVLATKLANVADTDLECAIEEIIKQYGIDMSVEGKVYIARDTRKSSLPLCEALAAGVTSIGGVFTDFGLLTTPQLHFIVRCVNTNQQYGEPSEEGYYKKISKAFVSLTEDFCSENKPEVIVDCANGVGGMILKKLVPFLNEKITFSIVNKGDGVLNYLCGADYVKVNQKEPPNITLIENQRYVSFDGDADRIIYYYKNKNDGKFHMLDGDKIAVLVARYLKDLLQQSSELKDVQISIIQTAYANGNSTDYIQNVLKLTPYCVSTGVKHLHHQAEKSEIGIYFEANGHGTILFSDKTIETIKKSTSPSAKKLLNFIDLVNQTVGDAISDMLIVEVILNSLNMTIQEWDSLYSDLPNKLLKLAVKDRNAITTTDAERRCVKPSGLQEAIESLVRKFGTKARSFIRPSGTEDVVRVYAEAETQILADQLAKQVANLVYDFADGTGQKFELN